MLLRKNEVVGLIDRFARHFAFDKIGVTGQRKIHESKIAVVGVGATGSLSAEFLVRAGVGSILLIDSDVVDASNLHRQSLYSEVDIGKSKVGSAKSLLSKINSEVDVQTASVFLSEDNLELLKGFDLILDCSDNMMTRRLINSASNKFSIPWIFCGASKSSGNVLFVSDSVVFDKFFDKAGSFDDCEQFGVISPAIGFASSIQVSLALQFIVNRNVSKKLFRFDVWDFSFDFIDID